MQKKLVIPTNLTNPESEFRVLSLQILGFENYTKTTFPNCDHHFKVHEMLLLILHFWFDLVMYKLLTVTATMYILSLHKYISISFWFSGDGKKYTTSLPKKSYLNGKLDEGEVYMVFQRGYLNVCLSLLFFLRFSSILLCSLYIFFPLGH